MFPTKIPAEASTSDNTNDSENDYVVERVLSSRLEEHIHAREGLPAS
jgi:hypothetical protein